MSAQSYSCILLRLPKTGAVRAVGDGCKDAPGCHWRHRYEVTPGFRPWQRAHQEQQTPLRSAPALARLCKGTQLTNSRLWCCREWQTACRAQGKGSVWEQRLSGKPLFGRCLPGGQKTSQPSQGHREPSPSLCQPSSCKSLLMALMAQLQPWAQRRTTSLSCADASCG